MFNKENKKIAELINNELKALCPMVEKLAKKTQETSNNTRKANNIVNAWQYPTNKTYALECGENWELIQNTMANDPQKWHKILTEKYNILHECQELENLAKSNYHNYLLYFCNLVSYLLRDKNNWCKFYEKKGIETLGEYLRDQTKQRIFITRDGGSCCYSFGDKNYYCYFNITLWGVGAISGNAWGSYREYEENEQPQEKPTTPKVYTLKQFRKIIKELKELEGQAKGFAKLHYDLTRETGLIYFIGGLETPNLKTWKMRE